MTTADDLRRFLRIAALAELTVSYRERLAIVPRDGRVEAHYEGMHVGAVSRAPADLEIKKLRKPILLDAKHVLDSLSLFNDEAEVDLTVRGSRLIVTSKGHRMSLALGEGESVRRPSKKKPDGYAVLKRSELTDAVKFLLPMTTRQVSSSAVLTGIYLVSDGDGLTLESTDGARVGRVWVSVFRGEGRIETIIPGVDLSMALDVLSRDQVTVRDLGNWGEVADRSTYVRMARLQGKWPNTVGLPAPKPVAKMGQESISKAVRAARIFTQAHDIHMTTDGNLRIVVTVRDEEQGDIRFLAGKAKKKFDIGFDVDLLSVAANLPEKSIDVTIPKNGPVLFSCLDWSYWLSRLTKTPAR